MVFLGDALPLGARLPNILQPHELGDWLMPWLQRNEDSDSEEILQGMLEESFDTIDRVGAAIAIHEKETYLAVPAWGCRFSLNPEGESVVELYAKPDDRWEQNEVSSRAISIVDKLVVLRDRLRDAYLVSSTLEGPINWTDESLICPPR
jgi:TPP-dependent 2-oxoacid decarboxylase